MQKRVKQVMFKNSLQYSQDIFGYSLLNLKQQVGEGGGGGSGEVNWMFLK